MGEHGRTRRRRRRRGANGIAAGTPAAATPTPAAPAQPVSPVPGPDAAPGGHAVAPPSDTTAADAADNRPGPPRARRKPRPSRDPVERSLRDLVGSGRSQVGVNGALRARDVNRPTDEDLAEAEANLTIVRRHWTPPADRPTPGTR